MIEPDLPNPYSWLRQVSQNDVILNACFLLAPTSETIFTELPGTDHQYPVENGDNAEAVLPEDTRFKSLNMKADETGLSRHGRPRAVR